MMPSIIPSITPRLLHAKSRTSPERHVVRYACASSTSPPITIGSSTPPVSSLRQRSKPPLWQRRYSNQMTTVSVPYITKCVHLSMKLMSSSGVSGTGIIHTTQMPATSRQERG